MRIIAGEFRGRPIVAPKGQTTRPTTDRVRESLFAALYSVLGGFDAATVLDAFAGSGALGLEALSRGAAHATFCEKDHNALSALQKNVALAGPDRTRIARIDVLRALPPRPRTPFSLVFFDPPYALAPGQVANLIGRLNEAGMLAPSALLTYEHDTSKRSEVAEVFDALPFHLVQEKTYGKTAIGMYQKD